MSLAAGDFDEDGVPDLVSGYLVPSGGLLALHRGNIDSIYPHHPGALKRKAEGTFTPSPFLSPPSFFELLGPPDFLGTGDFDGDGHVDVVTASAGAGRLHLLSGDGRGGLAETWNRQLPGTVTALATGEMNRADGLLDVVVGVNRPDGSQVLVFESPQGALRGEPEAFPLPANATALALGELEAGRPRALIAAAGRDVVIVYGRDRRLPLDERARAKVPPAITERLKYPFAVGALAVGDFAPAEGLELALLAEHGSVYVLQRETDARPWIIAHEARAGRTWEDGVGHDHVLLRPGDSQLHILSRVAGPDRESWTSGCATLDVGGEPVAALPMRLNQDALDDLVVLRRGRHGLGVALTAPLSTFSVDSTGDTGDAAPGDGSCDDGAGNCTLRAALEEANASLGADAIHFGIPGPGPYTIRPASALPSIEDPVTVDGTTQPGFAGLPIIELDGSDVEADGLEIEADDSVIRGLVINRFGSDGVSVLRAEGSVIEGNHIGTDLSAGAALGNDSDGVDLSVGANDNTVGGTTVEARNVISGNGRAGINVFVANRNQIQGNQIGTDITGTLQLGNSGDGVFMDDGISNTIGGTAAGARNLISGNLLSGVVLSVFLSVANLVQGNYVGTDVTGTAGLGNTGPGVLIYLSAFQNTIGGTTDAARNVISANGGDGVTLGGPFAAGEGVEDNLVLGNYIGTDVTGTLDLGNTGDGVFLEGVNANTIGGTSAGAANVISGNDLDGVHISLDEPSTDNLVQGNLIGTDVTGVADVGNTGAGVFISASADGNSIGGTAEGASNTIAFNNGGVVVLSGDANAILSNSIFSNGGLGIDLAFDGVTDNDPGDADVGANKRQNFPELSSAVWFDDETTIEGTLDSASETTFQLEFFSNSECDASDHGEGATLLGSVEVTTDAAGEASFRLTFETAVPEGHFVTATATDPDDNTSEFSQCVEVVGVSIAEQIMQVVLPVRRLVDQGSLSPAQGRSLVVKLEKARRAVIGGRPDVAIQALRAFVAEVEHFIATQVLTAEEGRPLIRSAHRLIAAIEQQP